jgi:hypothetical protein
MHNFWVLYGETSVCCLTTLDVFLGALGVLCGEKVWRLRFNLQFCSPIPLLF